MSAYRLLLICCVLTYGSRAMCQCSTFSTTHYNLGNLPATLSAGVHVSVSGNHNGPCLSGHATSCGLSEPEAVYLRPAEYVTFHFSQPVYDITLSLQSLNPNENGTITTNGGIASLTSSCPSDFTITGNNFQRTGGNEWYNGFSLLVTIPNGATEVTVTCNYVDEFSEDSWCVELLDCINANTVGVEKYMVESQMSVFPNPSNGFLTVDLGRFVQAATLSVLNILGSIKHSKSINNARYVNLELPKPNGVYSLQLVCETGQVYNLKVIKQ